MCGQQLNQLPEVYKVGNNTLRDKLFALICRIWHEERLPADLRDATIVTLFKKGNRSDCGNYHGISLLSTAGNILARLLQNRLSPEAEQILPESQCGFRPSSGTVDMIFSARQLQEKCIEQQKPLFMTFFDLSKAFDSVDRGCLWEILSRYAFVLRICELV